MSILTKNWGKVAVIAALLALFLLLDVFSVFGDVSGVQYLFVVSLSIWFEKRSAFVLALISSVFILLGWYLAVSLGYSEAPFLNRLYILIGIFGVAFVLDYLLGRVGANTIFNYSAATKTSKWFKISVILGLLTVTVLIAFIYNMRADSLEREYVYHQQEELAKIQSKTQYSLEELFSDAVFLSDLESVKHYGKKENIVVNDFSNLMTLRGLYDQVRILDNNGFERVRVNFVENQPVVVSEDKLQDKSTRDYFLEAKDLEKGDFYVSRVDLNVENNQIEVPHKPIMRVVTPISSTDSIVGMLVINYRAADILNSLNITKNQQLEDQILDGNGYWLAGVEESKLYGFLFSDKKSGFSYTYPQVWNTMTALSGTVEKEGDVFLYSRFDILDLFWKKVGKRPKTSNDPELIFVRRIPSEVLWINKHKDAKKYASYYAIFVVLYTLGAWFISRKQKEAQLAEEKFQNVFNHTYQFMGLISTDGTLLEANDTALDFAGVLREQALGRKFWDGPWWSIGEGTRDYLKEAVDKAAQGEFVRYEVDVQGKDEVITIDFSLRPIFAEDGETVEYIIPEGRNITEKSALQRKLFNTNKLFEETQEIAKIGYWSVDLEQMMVSWSDQVYRIHEIEFGKELSVEEGINFYREDYRGTIQGAIDKAIQFNKHWDEEAIILTRSGKEKWVRAIGYPVFRDGKLKELRGLFMDIDRRKKEEIRRKLSEERLKLAVEAGNLGIWDWDILNDKLVWEDSMYHIYNVDRKNFTNDFAAWQSTLHPDDLEKASKEVETALKECKPLNTIFRIINQSGETRYIQAYGDVKCDKDKTPVRMTGVNFDITEKFLIEQELKELNADLEKKVLERTAELRKTTNELEQQLSLLDAAAIISITDVKGNMTYVNDTFCQISGYSREELIGKNHRILKSGRQPEGLFVGMWAAISQGKTWKGEICNKRKDGSFYWVSTMIKPFSNEKGEIEKYVGVRFDVTEMKEAEEKLKQKSSELERINRRLDSVNKELETFSYSVSHDLKAPLRALQGFSENLLKKYNDQLDETGSRWLEFIRNNSERMDQLIQDILSFSRISKKEIVKVDVNMKDLVEREIEVEKEVYHTPLEIEVGDLPKARGDHAMLAVVWQNLISNAFKYSHKKDVIKIKIDGFRENGSVHYSIQDNGVGFDMRYYDKVFGIFQRAHGQDEFEGTGVGLANVLRVIEKHDGEIKADSKPGEGSRFEFILPAN